MGTPIELRTDLESSPWTDLQRDDLRLGRLTRVGLLPNGTVTGRATVAVVGEMEDGTPVILETTWALFNAAAHALAVSPIAVAEPEPI